MKLSEILGISKEQLLLLDIVDVYFEKNRDVSEFLDLTKFDYLIENSSSQFIERVTQKMSLAEKVGGKLLKNFFRDLSSEKAEYHKFGLGFSKGKEFSHPRGADEEAVKRFFDLAIQIKEVDQGFLSFGILRAVLERFGVDSFSDILINVFHVELIQESEKLIHKLDKLFELNKFNLFITNHKNGWISLNHDGVDRFLINAQLIYDYRSHGIEEEIAEELDSLNTEAKKKKVNSISNDDLKDKLQSVIEFNLNEFTIEAWKTFVGNFEFFTKWSKTTGIRNPISYALDNYLNNNFSVEEIVSNAIHGSKSDRPKEDYFSNAIKAQLSINDIKFFAESNEKSGSIDIYIPSRDMLIELKSVNSGIDEAKIKDYLNQLIIYSNEKNYKTSNLFLVMYIDKKDEEKIKEVLFKENISKKINIITHHWNYKTASKIKSDEDYNPMNCFVLEPKF